MQDEVTEQVDGQRLLLFGSILAQIGTTTTARSGGRGAGPSRPELVRRLADHPVADAASVPGYGAVFNAGVLYHEGTYHLFARAVRSGYHRNTGAGARFVDYVSDVVVLTSSDGLDYRFAYVLAKGGGTRTSSFEDPRVQRVAAGDGEHLVMTYTALPPPGSGLPWRIGAHKLAWDGRRFRLQPESGRLLGPDDIQDKDAVILALTGGRVALVHRIHPNMQLAVFDDLDQLMDAGPAYWGPHVADLEAHTLLRPSPGALSVGGGAPPVATDQGLLLFFHERRADCSYTMNLALLDPTSGELVNRLSYPILEPMLEWERRGDVDGVIFVQGAHRAGDTVYLTYGAADDCVGAATASVCQLLNALAASTASGRDRAVRAREG
jgi:predicted GH43/DUF377 family glycosyl hydrolase